MKNLFFLVVPVLVSLTGCGGTTGPGNGKEGEGEVSGEGEGEQGHFKIVTMLFPATSPPDSVMVGSQEADPVDDTTWKLTLDSAGSQSSTAVTKPGHLYTTKTADLQSAGDETLDWTDIGQSAVNVSGHCTGSVLDIDVAVVDNGSEIDMQGFPVGGPITETHFDGTNVDGDRGTGDVTVGTGNLFQIHYEKYAPNGDLQATDNLNCQ